MTAPLARLRQLERAVRARRYGRIHGIPGLEFDAFGRRAALRLLRAGDRTGWTYLVNPVSIVRYWEFDFVAGELPEQMDRAADIASPRLFSFWVASERPEVTIDLLNPDEADTELSKTMATALKQPRVRPVPRPVDRLEKESGYDVIWSISVVEHIGGPYDDTDAIGMMIAALRPGGHLLLTVPVDRKHHDEYRAGDPYGTQHEDHGRFFFQRLYDEGSARSRLTEPFRSMRLVTQRWFGEREAGHFVRYEREWIEQGLSRTVEDPREIADHYTEYHSWEDMPGMGVCGLHLVKLPDGPPAGP